MEYVKSGLNICKCTWTVHLMQRGRGRNRHDVSQRVENGKFAHIGLSRFKNEAEYEALIVGLRAVQKLGAEEVEVFFDSRLVVSQIEGSIEKKYYCMSLYLKLFGSLRSSSQKVSIVRVPRSQNSHVD